MSIDKTAVDFIAWCRAEAMKYTELANTVEAKLRASGTIPLALSPSDNGATLTDEAVIASAKKHLAISNLRMKNLRDITGASKRQLKRVLTADNGFDTSSGRGWVKLLEEEEKD